jgi:alpha-galactosidase
VKALTVKALTMKALTMRTLLLCGALALLGGLTTLSTPAPGEARVPTVPTVLTPTPYMGWDTYFALGPRYSESTVLEEASALVDSGLSRLGYRYVWLDVGWWQGRRDSHGQMVVNRSQWPHGMAWLTFTLHSAGLLAGLYTDAGSSGCGGPHEGSYHHYRQDADTFAQWGFDAVKVDFCGGVRRHLNPRTAYMSFHRALQANSRHRPMLLSICNFLEPGQFKGEPPFDQSAFSSYTFGPSIGNSWRTDTDVGSPGHVTFMTVLRNLDADAAHPEAAAPGHWNDPDYLGPDQGLTAGQFQAQLTMWVVLAAPLMISDDLLHISPLALSELANRQAVAIDQDLAGVQGTLLSTEGEGQIWIKPLHDGSEAVAFLDRGPKPVRLRTSAAALGLRAASQYEVRDIWAHSRSTTTGAIEVDVSGESAELLRIAAQSSGAG